MDQSSSNQSEATKDGGIDRAATVAFCLLLLLQAFWMYKVKQLLDN